MFWHIIEPTQVPIQTAAGFGSFVFLMITRKMGWINVLILFAVAQITAYYFTVPIAMWRGWSPQMYGTLGFTIGAFAMVAWSAVIALATSFRDDPKGTLTWAWRLWRGRDRDNYGSWSDSDGRPMRRDPKDGGIP